MSIEITKQEFAKQSYNLSKKIAKCIEEESELPDGFIILQAILNIFKELVEGMPIAMQKRCINTTIQLIKKLMPNEDIQ